MLNSRALDQSIVDHLAALFTAPPNGFTNAFHVYYAEDYFNPLFAPETPYLWLVNKRVRPTQTRLPLLILNRGPFGWTPFELGNREGQVCSYSFIVYGRNDGEVTDLIDFIKKNLDPIPFYDYSTEPKTLKYKAHVDHMVNVPNETGGEVGMEAALQFQEALAFDFMIKEF